jgi:DNA-binding CsgD family transcriptional regulator
MLSNIDLLLKFGAYFEVISQPLIKTCQKKPIYLPKYNESKPIPEIKFLIERDKILNDIHSHKSRALLKKHNDTDLIKQKYNLISYTNFSTLSIRENECLSLIAKGYTAKEVARVLGLSFRTVEEYINRIKNKLGCFSRRELISTFAHFTQKGF